MHFLQYNFRWIKNWSVCRHSPSVYWRSNFCSILQYQQSLKCRSCICMKSISCLFGRICSGLQIQDIFLMCLQQQKRLCFELCAIRLRIACNIMAVILLLQRFSKQKSPEKKEKFSPDTPKKEKFYMCGKIVWHWPRKHSPDMEFCCNKYRKALILYLWKSYPLWQWHHEEKLA